MAGTGASLVAHFILLTTMMLHSEAVRCDWGYEGHSSGPTPFDNRFMLNVSTDANGYRAGAVYDVMLQGHRSGSMTEKFIGFVIVAETEDPLDSENDKKVGTFQIVGDSLTKYSDKCQNAVTQTSFLPKPEIQVLWIAPPTGSGCVTIKATVVEHRDIWYMDDTALSKTICEDTSQGSSHEQPPVLSKCCACYEAKYEVTFEGLWSRHTHPKDFPPNGWSTRFSDIIGASHTADYSFWEYDKPASDGLRELAEHGSTNKLERELKDQSTSIRTIIKARGISYPNLTGKTFAVLRVTNEHHLMSLVSRIDPSPDWIVGISGLELCLESCTWIESMVWDLYPWDIGTDSGITYTASNHPTVPPDVIHRIGPDYPKDPESPFYDPTGKEMKPLARLNITRQRLYEKNCNESNTGENGNDNSPCATTSWSDWSECSETCGPGIRHRQKSFRNTELAKASKCNVKLTDYKKCFGPRRHCRVPSEYEPDPAQMEGPCALTEWSSWSRCSKTCARGHKVRSRKFRIKGAMKRCHQGYRTMPVLQQTLPCFETSDECPEVDIDIFDKNNENIPPNCHVSSWSDWEPCSVTCGVGQRTRTRTIMKGPRTARLTPEIKENLLIATTIDDADYDEDSDNTNNNKNEEPESNEDNENSDPCEDVQLRETVQCNASIPSCEISESDARIICSLPKAVGPCRGYVERWFFDVSAKTCEPFGYTGCQGNRNNFLSHHECMRACRSYKEDLRRIEKILEEDMSDDEDTSSSSSSSNNVTFYNIEMQDDAIDDLYDSNYNNMLSRSHTSLIGNIVNNRNSNDETTEIPFPDRDEKSNRRKNKNKKLHHNGRHSSNYGDAEYYNQRNRDDNQEYVVVENVHGKVRDCRVSEWTDWSQCSVTCGNGYKERSRTIIHDAWNGGQKCPDQLFQKQRCKMRSCHHRDNPDGNGNNGNGRGYGYRKDRPSIDRDCILDEWSPWSTCTETCGPRAVKQRTRRILQAPSGNGERCEARIEKANCQLMPCLFD